MFNFTTQSIVNTLVKRDTDHPEGNLIIPKTGNLNKPSIRVNTLGLDSGSIISVEKKLPSPEIKAHVEFDLNDIDSENGANCIWVENGPTTASCRVAFYIGLHQTSNDAYYANDFVYKGKPLYVEFPLKKGGAAAAATKLKKLADKVLVMDGPILRTTVVDRTKVKFEAVNGYQIIREAALQVYDDSIFAIDCCSSEGGFKNVITGVHPKSEGKLFTLGTAALTKKTPEFTPTEKEDGTAKAADEVWIYPSAEAFCDYEWIMHNLRLPTHANTNYWSPTKMAGELPVMGGNYIQYTIRMQKVRDNIAGEVVGQRAVSVTTHVLYVLNTNTQGITDFENALRSIKNVYGEAVEVNTSVDKKLTGATPIDYAHSKFVENADLQPLTNVVEPAVEE